MAIVDEKDQKERTEAESADALDLSAGPSYLEVPGEVSLGPGHDDHGTGNHLRQLGAQLPALRERPRHQVVLGAVVSHQDRRGRRQRPSQEQAHGREQQSTSH